MWHWLWNWMVDEGLNEKQLGDFCAAWRKMNKRLGEDGKVVRKMEAGTSVILLYNGETIGENVACGNLGDRKYA